MYVSKSVAILCYRHFAVGSKFLFLNWPALRRESRESRVEVRQLWRSTRRTVKEMELTSDSEVSREKRTLHIPKVRIFGDAVELNEEQLSKHWESEPVFAKIRSRICECGKPVDPAELRRAHDALLKAYQDGEDLLPQTETYTGFKILPTVWDFYKSQPSSIADRVVYKRQGECGNSWTLYHVAA